MKIARLMAIAALGVMVLSGCRSSRNAQRTDTGKATSRTETTHTETTHTETDRTETTRTETTSVEALTAKLNLTLASGSKKLNVGGTYRLKRNDVIQVNLVYTVLVVPVNVGTLEITPDGILLVDRINKRYCRTAYADLPQLAQAGIDFDFLQRVFWGEAEESPTKVLEWAYDNWQSLSEGRFPGQITFSTKMSSASYKATFNLSNIKENAGWETRTDVPSKYTPVSLDAVMKALMSAAS